MKHTLYKEADYKTSEHMGGTAGSWQYFPTRPNILTEILYGG